MARKSNKTARKTQTQAATPESASDVILGEHPCLCGKFEIERGDVPEGADPNEYLTFEGTDCQALTTRTFAPGHDAKLKSLLIKAGGEGASVRCEQGGMAITDDAKGWAAKFDFGHMVIAGILRNARRAADKAANKIQRDGERADRAAAKAATKGTGRGTKRAAKAAVKAEPTAVTIKVGRWTYAAYINEFSNEATFTSANGETKTVPAGKYSIVAK